MPSGRHYKKSVPQGTKMTFFHNEFQRDPSGDSGTIQTTIRRSIAMLGEKIDRVPASVVVVAGTLVALPPPTGQIHLFGTSTIAGMTVTTLISTSVPTGSTLKLDNVIGGGKANGIFALESTDFLGSTVFIWRNSPAEPTKSLDLGETAPSLTGTITIKALNCFAGPDNFEAMLDGWLLNP